MSNYTRRYLDMCEDLKNYYTVNKDNIDTVKAISLILPVLSEMIDTYNTEFENSIAYLQLHMEEKAKKRINLEDSCGFIYNAIRQYSEDNQNLRYLDFGDYTPEKLKSYSDNELREKLNIFVEVVTPMVGILHEYGITNSRLKALSFHTGNFLPAIPIHVSEIEQRKHGYRSAMNCIASIEEYLQL